MKKYEKSLKQQEMLVPSDLKTWVRLVSLWKHRHNIQQKQGRLYLACRLGPLRSFAERDRSNVRVIDFVVIKT